MIQKPKLSLLLFVAFLITACESKQLIHESSSGNELFKVSILYPNGEDKTFDLDYYQNKHMPMVAGFLGENLSFYEIDKGIAGRTPDEKVPYVAIGYFYVKDISEYNKAIGENREAVVSDIKNYTNIRPIIQISEIKHIGFNRLG
jgi:uncharacterized protein (TIGR02118 family)